MDFGFSATRWVLGKALSAAAGNVLEVWAAGKNLCAETDALTSQLRYAQAMLNSTRGMDINNPELNEILLKLRLLAYDADDVLDELDYFRIQDELDGTYHAASEHAGGCVHGLFLHARHTAKAVAAKLKPSSGSRDTIRGEHDEQDNASQGSPSNQNGQKINAKFRQKLTSITWSSARGNGRQVQTMQTPKLKFDSAAVSTKMTDIVEKLKPICAMVFTILNLELLGSRSVATTTTEWPIISEDSTEPKLYGREIEQQRIVDSITHGEYSTNEITVLPIVGPGGIGKTTFAQHVYQEVKSHFQVTIWICVSLNFSANRLAQEASKKIPLGKDLKDYGSVQELIEKRLEGKRFLLVLDDIWQCHENEWEKLLAPFRKGGGKGSMVIVTTRMSDVAKMVKTVDSQIELDRLGDEDFRDFFDACVSTKHESWSDHPELLEIGEEIMIKLKGSPLAAKTVGRVLRKQITLDHWRRVLGCKEWELQTSDNDIMPALNISYDYLPLNLKQCFSYFALFPEDYEFESKELIQFWIGLGVLSPGDHSIRIEEIGKSYIINLVNYGFFEMYEKDNGQCYYVIHDLLHELAVKVSRYDCISIKVSEMRYIHIPASVRHLSIMVDKKDSEDKITFKDFEENLGSIGKRLQVENLRTLMLFGENVVSFSKTVGNVFQQARALRTIFLSQASYNVEVMLHDFSNLIHLRYLKIKGDQYLEMNLSGTISRLYHLKILDMEDCCRCSIPSRDLSNLINMQYFIVPDKSYHSC